VTVPLRPSNWTKWLRCYRKAGTGGGYKPAGSSGAKDSRGEQYTISSIDAKINGVERTSTHMTVKNLM